MNQFRLCDEWQLIIQAILQSSHNFCEKLSARFFSGFRLYAQGDLPSDFSEGQFYKYDVIRKYIVASFMIPRFLVKKK